MTVVMVVLVGSGILVILVVGVLAVLTVFAQQQSLRETILSGGS